MLLCWHLLLFVGLSGFCNYLHCCKIICSCNLICRPALLHLPPWPFVAAFQASREMSVLLPLCRAFCVKRLNVRRLTNYSLQLLRRTSKGVCMLAAMFLRYPSWNVRFYMGMSIFDHAIHSQNGTCIFASFVGITIKYCI